VAKGGKSSSQITTDPQSE